MPKIQENTRNHSTAFRTLWDGKIAERKAWTKIIRSQSCKANLPITLPWLQNIRGSNNQQECRDSRLLWTILFPCPCRDFWPCQGSSHHQAFWVCWPIKESNTTMVQASTLEQYSTSLQDPSLDRSSAHAISSSPPCLRVCPLLLEEQEVGTSSQL